MGAGGPRVPDANRPEADHGLKASDLNSYKDKVNLGLPLSPLLSVEVLISIMLRSILS
jgi:hypothetical protein